MQCCVASIMAFLGSMLINKVSMLFTGGAVAQIILFAGQIMLAKMYLVADFGYLSQLLSIASFVFMLGSLQMHQAVVLPEHEEESLTLFAVGVYASIFICSVLFIIMIVYRESIFGEDSNSLTSIFCFLMAMELCVVSLVRGWQTARNNFKALSVHSVFRAIAIVGSQFMFNNMPCKDGLILGAIVGEMLAIVLLLKIGRLPKLKIFSQVARDPGVMIRSLWHYRSFSIVGTIQETVSTGGFLLPMYLFTRIYDVDTGGQFAMAQKVAWAPILLIATSIAQVYYHHFSRTGINALAAPDLYLVGKGRLGVIVAGSVAMALAPTCFVLLLGQEWELAGEMSRWLVLWGMFFILAIPYRVCFRVLHLQSLQLIVDSCFFLVVFSLFVFMSSLLDPLQLFIYISLCGVLQNITLFLIIKFYPGNKLINA